jgi:antitoxin VapB
VITPWHESRDAVTALSHGSKLASDGFYPGACDVSAGLARLRSKLSPEEGYRFRELGKYCAQAMQLACESVHPGQSEFEIASRLAYEAERQGVQAIVNLIATDERIYAYRHPLPTAKKLERYAMLILCGRKYGLICSLTRLVYFGALPDELKHKVAACARVDAALINSTRPGSTLGSIFDGAIAAYADSGYSGEWHKHHQGGVSGYEPREYLGLPGSADVVSSGQAYAWNPSITGYKSEDTILVGPQQNEVLTAMPDWPAIIMDGLTRPTILVK